MKLYWFGYGGSKYLADELRPLIEQLNCSLITISEWPGSDIIWDRSTWLTHLRQADVIIIPQDYITRPCKSANRLTQSMSLGIPCIVSPLPSYLEIIKKYPDCALVATTQDDWRQAIETLKDPQKREQIKQNALIAAQEFSLDKITSKWEQALNTPKVDIIIPTYKNLTGLKQCLESIRTCTKEFYNIIIINNGDSQELHEFLTLQKDITYIKKSRLNFAQAVNIGIKQGNSKYVMILNDDTIVSHNWLTHLISTLQDNTIGAVGPLSNCDKSWLHNIDIRINTLSLLPGCHEFSEITPLIPAIYSYVSPHTQVLDHLEWIAFYCTITTRDVIKQVGLLNEEFTNSGEDVDYCSRIKKAGYKIAQNYNSFVFHYGAVSRKQLESEDKQAYQESDKKTNRHLQHIMGKKSIVLYSGPAWERWNYNSINSGGIGGSETHQIRLAEEFAKLNYRVTSFCDTDKTGSFNGVNYQHFSEFPNYIEQHYIDYFISERTEAPFALPIRAGKKFVQIHDVFLLSGKQVQYSHKIDKFCVLSNWHLDFVSQYHNLPKEKLALTSNGIDLNRFSTPQERHPHRLIYSSSLDRGLDTLLYLFDFIKQQIPDLELHIFYGLDLWEKLRPDQKEEIERIKKEMSKPGVFYHGRISQQQLAIEMMKSSLWVYPTDFEETYCITALEAQAAGLPVIASNFAGIQTTVNDTGILIGNGSKGQSLTRECRIEFVNKTIELLTNKDTWAHWSQKGLQNVQNKTWAESALIFARGFADCWFTKRKTTLSLAMIVKNSGSCLDKCLSTFHDLFNEIIIVDTGSTDNTKEIAQKYNARIYDFKWINDFSAARNYAFSKCTSDYIFWCDDDDYILEEDKEKIRNLVFDRDMIVCKYVYAHYSDGSPELILDRERFIKRSCNLKWEGRIHECIPLVPNRKTENIFTHHNKKGSTLERNLEILKQAVKEEPNDSRYNFYYAKELFDSGKKEESIPYFKKCIKSPDMFYEDKILALESLALISLSNKNEQEFKEYIFKSLMLEDMRHEGYYYLAENYMSNKQYRNAIHWYKVCANTIRNQDLHSPFQLRYISDSWLQLCVAYNFLGMTKESYLANEEFLKLKPNDERGLNNKKLLQKYA
jgi:GT2 family glycosyltransferase